MRSTNISQTSPSPEDLAGPATGLDLLRQAVEKLRTETDKRCPGTVIGDELRELHWLIESERSIFHPTPRFRPLRRLQQHNPPCRPHHRRVHEEGWRLVRDGAGGLQARPP